MTIAAKPIATGRAAIAVPAATARGSILTGGMSGWGATIIQEVGRSSQCCFWPDRLAGEAGSLHDDAASATASPEVTVMSPQRAPQPLEERARWIGSAGERQVFGGQAHHLMFCYIGSSRADAANPAVIDPALEIAETGGGSVTRHDEFTAYRDLSPVARREFINWNAAGRQSANVSRSFLLLFVSALEHAIFRDGRREDLPAIRDELSRLIALHQKDPVFCSIARRLSLACALLDPVFVPDPITSHVNPNYRDEMPLDVRLFLGWMFRTAGRLEADAALLYFLQQPRTRLEPSVANHFREIREIWCLRFPHVAIDSFSGLARAPRLKINYEPICGTFDCICESGLPDIGTLAVPHELRELYRACTDLGAELPNEPGRLLPALPVLAAGRGNASSGDFILNGDATSRLQALVPRSSPTDLPVSDLLGMLLDIPPSKPNKVIPKKLAKEITDFLDEQGFGFEPDPRFGLPNLLRPDAHIVLFRQEVLAFEEPIDAYLLAQAAILVSSLGHCWFPSLQPLELRCIEQRLPYVHRFSDREFRRLEATRCAVASVDERRKFFDRWLKILWRERRVDDLVRGFGIAFKGQCRNSQLPKHARAISISCPGAISPEQLLHAATAKPVDPPYEHLDARAEPLVGVKTRKIETADVAREVETVETPSRAINVEGLDVRHAGLLLALHERSRTQAEFEELARSRRLSPASAVDRINEWSLLQLGFAAIVEGDDYTLTFQAAEHVSSLVRPQ